MEPTVSVSSFVVASYDHHRLTMPPMIFAGTRQVEDDVVLCSIVVVDADGVLESDNDHDNYNEEEVG